VTRCGTARKARRLLKARRDCHCGMRRHGRAELPERRRTAPATCSLLVPHGLTNEVQRRAARKEVRRPRRDWMLDLAWNREPHVRCNAGLGRAAVTVGSRACFCPIDRDPSLTGGLAGPAFRKA